MEKRVLLAVGLSVAVLLGFNVAVSAGQAADAGGHERTRHRGAPSATSPSTPAATDVERGPRRQPPRRQRLQRPLRRRSSAIPPNGEIVVENEAVRATFSTRGGVLTSWRLKHYAENGAPLELIPANAPAGSTKPFTLVTDDQAVNAALAQALFKPSADVARCDRRSGDSDARIPRRQRPVGAQGVLVLARRSRTKSIFSADVNRGGTALLPTIAWGPALGTGRVSSGMTYAPSPQPIYYRDGSVAASAFAEIAEHRRSRAHIGFGGVDDHYFLAAVVAPGQPTRLQYEPVPVRVPGSDRGLHFVSWSVRPPTRRRRLRFFAGPKDFNVLEKTDRDLVARD